MSSVGGEPEDVRNRLLRRADWRFLLPEPCPSVSLCFNDGGLRDAVRRISRAHLQPEDAADDECDLAVASDPSLEVLAKAFASLRPGGSCYVEHSARFATSRAVRGQLLAAGFRDVRTYRPWPSAERCRAWIPLDEPGVASAYFRREDEAAVGLRRLVRRGRRGTEALRQRLERTACVCVIGRKASAAAAMGRREPQPEFLEVLSSQWAALGLGPEPPRLSPVLQTGGRRSINKVIGLVFDRDRRLAAAVKIARVPDAAAGLAREAETLDAVHAMPRRPGGIPRVLFCCRRSEVVAVGESALCGVPISDVLARTPYRDLATAATDWLTRLALASRAAPAGWAEVSASALRHFDTAYGAATGPGLQAAVRHRLAEAPALPTVCEHRDFSPWNVCIDRDDSLSVFDWESSVRRGVPGLDLIYFLSYLAWYSEPASRPGGPSYRAAWDESTSIGRVNVGCLMRYARAVGIDPSAFHSLRLLTWLVHSRSEYLALAADGGAPPSPAVLRQGLFLTLVDEEIRHGGTP